MTEKFNSSEMSPENNNMDARMKNLKIVIKSVYYVVL